MRVALAELRREAERVLRARGVRAGHAAATAEILVEAEAEGLASHGLSRLLISLDQLAQGGLNARAELAFQRARPGLGRLEADGALGPAAALRAVDEAARLAGEAGLGAVAVRRAGHVGALSGYARRLAERDLLGIAVVNSPPAMAPWGGAGTPVLGTNPIAFAAPGGVGGDPMIVDLSLSVAARGKVLEARRAGEAIPAGWAVDARGRPATDPEAALAGALLPAGGAKGYALALMVEVLAGAWAGEALSADIPLPWKHPDRPSTPGLLLLALDPASAGDRAGFGARMDRLARAIFEAGGRLPGARRRERARRAEREGVDLGADLAARLAEAGLQLTPISTPKAGDLP